MGQLTISSNDIHGRMNATCMCDSKDSCHLRHVKGPFLLWADAAYTSTRLHPLTWSNRTHCRYCESIFFRSRIVPDMPEFESAESCRRAIDFRNLTCYTECGEFGCRSGRTFMLDNPKVLITGCCHNFCARQIRAMHFAITEPPGA